jgi:hypothetical protein
VSFTVTTVSGSEDFTARLLRNPSKDHTMRVDYFRRMRQWRSDLYRYGVRMTYDVVLPDPGRSLRDNYYILREFEAALTQGFTPLVTPNQITYDSWPALSEQWRVPLPAPPPKSQRLEASMPFDFPQPDPNLPQQMRELKVDIPPGMDLQSATAYVRMMWWTPPAGHGMDEVFVTIIPGNQSIGVGAPATVIDSTKTLDINKLPHRGTVAVQFLSQFAMKGVYRLTLTVGASADAVEQWRNICWGRLRDAAYAQYLQRMDFIREQRAALLRIVSRTDPLLLRRLEREQIMRSVLLWLFPDFGQANSVLTTAGNPATLSDDSWRAIMEYGEYIKFVHSAVDWDNVMVLLYPYFWDAPGVHDFKQNFDHPDPIHREFIRAGAARVVLAIRPGFEEQLVSLLEKGHLGSLPHGDRFQKVVEDVQKANDKYAETAAGDDDENPGVPGKLIGTWHDYTPTGALDISVVTDELLEADE